MRRDPPAVDADAAHWNERARQSFPYRGESIYTITPIPFYLARRRVLVELVAPYVVRAARICDYGCGDGWYLRHFGQLNPAAAWTAVDVAPAMLELAARQAPHARLLSPTQDWGRGFDLIYCLAVLAHVDDGDLAHIVRDWHARLENGGRVVIFEQVGASASRGATYVRRTARDYLESFAAAGYEFEDGWRISFDAHRWFERFVAKRMYARCFRGDSDARRRLAANRSWFFRALPRFFVALSYRRVRRDLNGYGNAVLVFRKIGG